MRYRFTETEKGWIVEKQVSRFCIFSKWVHVTSYSGLPNEPFYYSSAERALSGAIAQIKEEIRQTFFK